jgi:hypothetical protein
MAVQKLAVRMPKAMQHWQSAYLFGPYGTRYSDSLKKLSFGEERLYCVKITYLVYIVFLAFECGMPICLK